VLVRVCIPPPRAEEGRALKLGALQPLHPALRWWQEEKARRAAAAAAAASAPPPAGAPPAGPRPTALACMSLALPLPEGWQAAARR
jgi:hypothetical protein